MQERDQESYMQASPTEYKRQKRESQVQKITQKTLTQQSKKIKSQKAHNRKHPGNPGNLRIIGIEESEDSQIKGSVNIFNKIVEESFPSQRNRCT